jgi:hypothetical protein
MSLNTRHKTLVGSCPAEMRQKLEDELTLALIPLPEVIRP